MKSGQKSNTKNEKAIISAIRSNPAISITIKEEFMKKHPVKLVFS